MSENGDDYLKFDLEAAAVEIRKLGADRGNHHDVFFDAILALDARCDHGEHITSDYVLRVLGEPDNILQAGRVEIWEYNALVMHGPDTYISPQSFVLLDGVFQGRPRQRLPEWVIRGRLPDKLL